VSDFKGRHFEGEIVLWAVRWYCRYGISYRDLEQMMTERGVSVDHSTIYRWVQRYAPEIEKRLRWHWRRPRSRSWRVDETYVKVRGKWSYLYRAVDKLGNTIDFYLSPTRNTIAAKRFLAKALRGLKDWEQPAVIHRQSADLCRRSRRAEGRRQVPEGYPAPPGQVSEQHRRSRPRQAQAADPAGARFQIDEDGLCDDQGL
jgi:transposase-like protein